MKVFQTILVSMAAVALVGCGSGSGTYKPTPVKAPEIAQLKPGDENIIWPLVKGNTWTYEVSTSQSTGGPQTSTNETVVFEVDRIIPKSTGGYIANVKTTVQSTEAKMVQQWEWTPKGLFQRWMGKRDQSFKPAQPAVMFPIKVGDTFRWKGYGPTLISIRGLFNVNSKVLGMQLVDTSMGTMSALCVEQTGTFKTRDLKGLPLTGQINTTSYWTPGVGLVRFNQRTRLTDNKGNQLSATQTIRIKSYVVKEMPKP